MLTDLAKLQKKYNKKVKDTIYYKWHITIPPDVVTLMDWEKNIDLVFKPHPKTGKLVIEKK